MKITRIAFRNPFDISANKLAKIIFNNIKNRHANGEMSKAGSWTGNAEFSEKAFTKPMSVTFKLKGEDYLTRPFLVDAAFGVPMTYDNKLPPPDTKTSMLINVHFSPTRFSAKDYDELYKMLIEAVRHEMEHMREFQESRISLPEYDTVALEKSSLSGQAFIDRFMERAKYLSDASEQMPFIRGMMLKAKKYQVPIENMINDLIQDILFGNNSQIRQHIETKYGMVANHVEQQLIDLYKKRTQEVFN